MTKKTKIIIAILISIPIIIWGLYFSANLYISNAKINSAKQKIANNELKVYTLDDLKPFDGTDDTKPIYVGLNGYVYDISAGREFYNVDGPYHYLAGRDSSTELNQIGGDIIKRKYPIIGVLK